MCMCVYRAIAAAIAAPPPTRVATLPLEVERSRQRSPPQTPKKTTKKIKKKNLGDAARAIYLPRLI